MSWSLWMLASPPYLKKSCLLPALLLLVVVLQMGVERTKLTTTTTTTTTTSSSADESLTPVLVLDENFQPLQPQSREEVLPWCSNDQIVQGQWIPVTLPQPPYMPLSPRVRCLRPDAFTKPFATWIWHVDKAATDGNDKCQMASTINRDALCRHLTNQTLALMGDSLTLEHYASLVHLLGDRAKLPPKAVQQGRIQRHVCSGTDCVDLVFVADFFFKNLTTELHRSLPRVVVLNRGAHYQPDDQLIQSLQADTLPALQQWNDMCGRLVEHNDHNNHHNHNNVNKPCLLVWRTTVPGHPYCWNFTQPSTSVAAMQAWIHDKSTKDSTVYRKGEYHWHDFARQNKLVTQRLAEWQELLTHVQLEIMDSYQTNILRPDNHRSHMGDCLHSCAPGGGSDWNAQWLFHIIMKQQQEHHQQQQQQQQSMAGT